MQPSQIVDQQRSFFLTGKTKGYAFRLAQLKKFKELLKQYEPQLCDALYKDFRKPAEETYINELSQLYHEINISIENLKDWMRPKSVSTNLVNLPGNSYLHPDPLGVSLVIGAWNYPYMITLHPVISAMAAGNTVIVKPSELAPNSSAVMADLINSNFDSEYMYTFEGGAEITSDILDQKLDKIFYTGGDRVGKIIMQAAAKHLTPVTLELGGKSPCIIEKDANLKVAAKRIVWGKYLNTGQTCVAPDHLYVHESIKSQFIEILKDEVLNSYGKDPKEHATYSRIINERHFDRLTKLIDQNKVIAGGEIDKSSLYIAPTILDNVSDQDPVMQEEIFGPILPILSYSNVDELVSHLAKKPSPLAFYLFTSSRKTENKIVSNLPFGGAVINDVVVHLSNTDLPFGGVGNSGMGAQHGKFGFDTFTHYKPVIRKATWIDPTIRYAPYTKWKMKILRWLLE